MKKTFIKFKNIFIAFLIYVLLFFLYPFAFIFLRNRKIWIITEREKEARDNGFVFFKYLRSQHPEIKCYYAIKKGSPDFKNVENLGNIIQFGSFKHLWYFCGAKYLVSSTIQAFCPHYFITLLRRKIKLPGKYIYLKHGIIKDNLIQLYKHKTKFNLFICGAQPEFEYIKSTFGYKENEVVYTGLARFDRYHNNLSFNDKIILVMPTWRRTALVTDFLQTDYFAVWSSFIKNKQLNELLEKNGTKLYFYMHPLFQKYSSCFTATSSNICICDFDHFNLQDLILEASCFITDYSSLAFDFGYMKKPVLYYQYDADEFYKKHYQKGYFEYTKNGFGPVLSIEDTLIQNIEVLINQNFEVQDKYKDRSTEFFTINDAKNCERIFAEIIKRF